jgi:L-2-hydroxyglutarate oxidase LhgO
MSARPLQRHEAIEIEAAVIGAGVVGLATARALQLAGLETVLIEANHSFGMETSSRNSEVIHAGIYYPKGSLKAQLCVRGKRMLYAYCEERQVPHRRIGKLIVATSEDEAATLETYRTSAQFNGVEDLTWVSQEELSQLEPEVAAVKALHSPSSGIIDSHAYMQALLHDFEIAGGHFVRGTRITAAKAMADGILFADAADATYFARYFVNSAGLAAPDLATRIEGLDEVFVPQAHYAIGHYFVLTGKSPFRHLVYPVAVAGGLGTHVTLDLAGGVRFGPDISWINEADYSFDASRKSNFADSIRRYYPGLDEKRLVPGYTGIRPKISGPGEPAADFVIQDEAVHQIPGLVNLFGIESPGLTSSLAIAETVVASLKINCIEEL